MDKYKKYQDSVKYLEGLINMRTGLVLKKNSENGPQIYLKRVQALLNEIKIDISKIKFIHITGTSGKGSVANLIYQNLHRQEANVGIFTSPFVTTTIEKIGGNSLFISPETFSRLTEYLKPFVDQVYKKYPYDCPSYFECILVIALLYFKEQHCEYVVLEAGIGGMFDATNIIKSPVISVITNVDLDHTEILGKTLLKIATDKAGIIKKGSRFYTAEQRPQLLSYFKKICSEKKAFFHHIKTTGDDTNTNNNQLAEAVLKELGYGFTSISDSETRSLPARFEKMTDNPLIIIDGAHNPAKIKSTANKIRLIKHKKCILILAFSVEKNIKECLQSIMPLADKIYITRFLSPFRKSASPKDIAAMIKKISSAKKQVHIILDPILAFEEATKEAREKDIIVVTGSFYLASDIRALYYPEETILTKRKSK